MTKVKVHPPEQLPATGVTDVKLNIWIDQLKAYLSQEDDYVKFLEGGDYAEWTAAEENPQRIIAHAGVDAAADLPKRRRQLFVVLTIIARSCQEADYNVVMNHSTSLSWIINKLREDHDIQRKGVHFLDFLDLKYDPLEER